MEDELESSKILWPNLVKELRDPNVTVEQALKTVTTTYKMSKFDVNYLPIYRWSRQFLDTPNDSEMQVVFAQRFFVYYLSRPPPDNQ